MVDMVDMWKKNVRTRITRIIGLPGLLLSKKIKTLPGTYFIVTFTTLGFGDIIPGPGWPQFWVALEVIMGYIMLGGLISILANKLARRS
jgi:hypothetical protein